MCSNAVRSLIQSVLGDDIAWRVIRCYQAGVKDVAILPTSQTCKNTMKQPNGSKSTEAIELEINEFFMRLWMSSSSHRKSWTLSFDSNLCLNLKLFHLNTEILKVYVDDLIITGYRQANVDNIEKNSCKLWIVFSTLRSQEPLNVYIIFNMSKACWRSFLVSLARKWQISTIRLIPLIINQAL